jgi:LysM repeat protein
MDDFNIDEVNQLPTTPAFLCPFLAMLNDAETYSANISFKNYCHKALPAAPVSIDQQVHVCCTENYRNCVVYRAPQPRNFPREWVYSEPGTSIPGENFWQRRTWMYAGIILTGLLLVIFIYLYWFSGLFHQSNRKTALIVDPSATMAQEAMITATGSFSVTPLPTLTHRPTLPSANIQTPTLTQTPTVFLTETLSPPSPTPGPELETPFGTQPLFLVHSVKEGESLSVIAANFKTTYAVIEVVNNLTADVIIREGTVLVVIPGQTSSVGLPVVKAIYITTAIRVEDFAANYGADVVEVRSFNGLGLDDWIQPNRWVVVRGK